MGPTPLTALTEDLNRICALSASPRLSDQMRCSQGRRATAGPDVKMVSRCIAQSRQPSAGDQWRTTVAAMISGLVLCAGCHTQAGRNFLFAVVCASCSWGRLVPVPVPGGELGGRVIN